MLMHQKRTAFVNTVGKGEIARNEQCLLFPQCFQLNQEVVSIFLTLYLYLLPNLNSLKLVYQVRG